MELNNKRLLSLHLSRPPRIQPKATAQASSVLRWVNLEIETYCKVPYDISVLIRGGIMLTSAFQSPILWWNMTDIPQPISWDPISWNGLELDGTF